MNSFPKTLAGFYWQIIKLFRWRSSIIVTLGIIYMSYGLFLWPFLSGRIWSIFDYTGPDVWAYARGIILLAFAMYLLPRPIWLFDGLFSNKSRPKMRILAVKKLYDYTYSADYKYFLDKNVGSIQSHVQNITQPFYDLTIQFVIGIFGSIIGLSILVVLLAGINSMIASIMLGYGILVMAWHFMIIRRRAKLQAEVTRVASKLNGTVSDSVLNFMNIKIFSSRKYEQNYVDKEREDYLDKQWASNKFWTINNQSMWSVMIFLWILLIAYCLYLFTQGQLNAGGFALILAAYNRFEQTFKDISVRINDAFTNWAEAKQAWGELIVPQTVADVADAKALKVQRGAVSFSDVSFKYHKEWVVHNFTLKIKPGEKVGIVGLSGAGKTTLSNLLLRLFDIQQGAIEIDGHNISKVKQESLRREIAFVPQDPVLFNRTLAENIGYARPGAGLAEIKKAAKLAHIHDFITAAPKGYDTVVGNRGIKLSGGQRQRIAIARAILKNSKILVLDEATSSLDSDTEAHIQKSLDALMKNRTTIAIAHRLSTLRKMDRIIVMKDGQVAEEGAHGKLLKKKNGIYARLWKMQSGGFI